MTKSKRKILNNDFTKTKKMAFGKLYDSIDNDGVELEFIDIPEVDETEEITKEEANELLEKVKLVRMDKV